MRRSIRSKRSALAFLGLYTHDKVCLALEVAKKLDIAYVNALVSTSDVMMPIPPSDVGTFGEKFQVQESILDNMEYLLTRITSMVGFAIDRTPIDILAQLLTSIDSTTSSIFDSRGQKFIDRCIALTAKHFSHLVIVPANAPDLRENVFSLGKTYNSMIYCESLTNMIIGTYYRYIERLQESREKTLIVIPDRLTNQKERVEFVLACLRALPI